jgi:hypothetical protein
LEQEAEHVIPLLDTAQQSTVIYQEDIAPAAPAGYDPVGFYEFNYAIGKRDRDELEACSPAPHKPSKALRTQPQAESFFGPQFSSFNPECSPTHVPETRDHEFSYKFIETPTSILSKIQWPIHLKLSENTYFVVPNRYVRKLLHFNV